jgi:hypothetical protein
MTNHEDDGPCDGGVPVDLSEVNLLDYSYMTVLFSNGHSVGQCSTADLTPEGIELAAQLAVRAAGSEPKGGRF